MTRVARRPAVGQRRPAHPAAIVLGWALVGPSAALAVARMARTEDHPVVVMAQALTPLFTLPSLAAVVVGAAARRRSLTAVAGALTGLHLAWALPELRLSGRPVEASNGSRMRLFCANLLRTNSRTEGIAAEIRESGADVVALQEVSPLNLDGLEASGALESFPYQCVDPRPDHFGTAVFSRLPLEDVEPWQAAGLPVPRMTVVVDDRRVRLYNVHVRAPMRRGWPEQWRAQLAQLARARAAERGPVVMAGDFNATSGHHSFRALLDAGLRDAHVERGRWWATTWRPDLLLVPPLARLDHVLVSPEVGVLEVWEGKGAGSDHRPVIADLALP